MMISNFRTYVRIALAGSVVTLVTLLQVTLAAAQEPVALAAIQLPVIAPAPAPPAFWELISGYEGDTHGSGYGFFGPSFVRPIRPGLAWTTRANGNYLSYQFSGVDGATRV